MRLDVYDPASQSPLEAGDLIVRTVGRSVAIVAAVQAAARALDPRVLVSNVTTMDAVVARAVAPWRFSVWVFGLFAALAVALATGGLFSVVSLDVGRRRRELAVRVALGAQRGDILRSVLVPAMQRLLAGVVLGVLVAAGGLRRPSRHAVRRRAAGCGDLCDGDPAGLGVVMAASYLPARRAAGADALAALRCE